jgi:DNA-binding CsgD family transcriptional regulator
MAEIWRITDWRLPSAIVPAYEHLIGAIGSAEFGAAVRHCVEMLTSGARRLYLFEVAGGGGDALRYHHCEPHIAGLLPAYSLTYKRLDPIGDLYPAAPRRGDMAVQRVRPCDIGSAEFRRRFFDEPGHRRADFAGRAGRERLARPECRPAPQRRRLLRTRARRACRPRAARLAHAAARPASGPVETTVTSAQLEERFARRWPALTARERQVCARAAIGLSVEATAIELGIAKTSVVTFRQRAYRRLGSDRAFRVMRSWSRIENRGDLSSSA